jgi:hypothetical protein
MKETFHYLIGGDLLYLTEVKKNYRLLSIKMNY